MAGATQTETVQAADVALDVRTGGSEAVYTYRVDLPLQPGDACFVPLGNRTVLGYVLRRFEADAETLGYPLERLRPIAQRIDGLSIPAATMDLVTYAAAEYLCPIPVALGAAIPPGALDRVETVWTLCDGGRLEDALTPLQAEILDGIRGQGGRISAAGREKLAGPMKKALGLLEAKGYLERAVAVAEAPSKRAPAPLLRLTPDAEKIDKFLAAHGKKRPAQTLAILRLREIEEASLTAADIKGLCGVTETTVRQLVEGGILEPAGTGYALAAKAVQPNADQAIAIEALAEAVRARESRAFLLFGVTGSGKTEVYLRAAAEAIRMGRQVLYLVPEIALATQAVKLLRERFGASVSILHSELPPAERLENWLALRSQRSSLVLGARSALFAPLRDIGLIVMDEEHEGSYKQESAPRYHAKRLARFLAERHGCPLALGSATPSIESFYEAEQERLTLLSLPRRAASARLPDVHVVDLGEGYRSQRPSIFTDELSERMGETLGRGEQTILFLNRRAYAPFLLCRDCGAQFVCPNCSVSLTYSRRSNRLRCHHCGYSRQPPDSCPTCGGTRLSPFGIGTEKVEEAVAERFPSARVGRLDRDVAQRKGALESVLGAFGAGEIDVLVGTQMVAKGLNFPGVTLVGVVAADLSLNIPDFRAAERTYQLLSQVAGRAGRADKPGHVVVQTLSPRHVAIEATAAHSYHRLYETALQERSEAWYPPYCRLANVVCQGADRAAVETAIRGLAEEYRAFEGEGARVLGPTDCAIERLAGNWRMHLLLKAPESFDMGRLRPALEVARQNRSVSAVADVDPYSLL